MGNYEEKRKKEEGREKKEEGRNTREQQKMKKVLLIFNSNINPIRSLSLFFFPSCSSRLRGS
jgi:hypothetical protein